MPQARIVVTINRECFECHDGTMKRIDEKDVRSFDFDEDGRLPPYCDSCGYGYREEIITPRYLKTRISNSSIESILKALCERGRNFDYSVYKEMYRTLQKKRIVSELDLAMDIAVMLDKQGILIDNKSIDNVIYKKVSYSS